MACSRDYEELSIDKAKVEARTISTTILFTAAIMAEKKRGAQPSKDEPKQTKRQRRAAAASAKQSYHKPKPQITNADTPLHELLPHQRIDLIADLSESVLEDPTAAVSSSRTSVTTENEDDPSSVPVENWPINDAPPGTSKILAFVGDVLTNNATKPRPSSEMWDVFLRMGWKVFRAMIWD